MIVLPSGAGVRPLVADVPTRSTNQSEVLGLSPKQLGDLAEKLASSNDPEEVVRLKDEIMRGFYGC